MFPYNPAAYHTYSGTSGGMIFMSTQTNSFNSYNSMNIIQVVEFSAFHISGTLTLSSDSHY